ncbi:MAG: SusC/RagA family TonB-linked outer membrane protein, partial [Sphingobacteriales bacterium]
MKIVICLWFALFFSSLQVDGQTANTLSGVVQDSTNGSPIQGVSVTIKNSSEGTSTDAQGRYAFTTTKSNGVLVFSRVGYQSKELPFSGNAAINVVLSESAQALNDVVVIGYTQQSTKKNTASISRLNPDELRNNPNSNPVQGLQGKIAGVSLPISQGQPGTGAVNIIIRGGTKPNVVVLLIH